MILLPAIDLYQKKCVRLHKGRFDQATIYSDDPVAQAQAFEAQGAKWLHVVDLEGAQSGTSRQFDIVRSIQQHTQLRIQLGGGMRCAPSIQAALELGVDRVIVGSMACQEIACMQRLIEEYGCARFVLALDVHIQHAPIVATHGWVESSNMTLWDLLESYRAYADLNVLCTDIDRDGVLQGPNVELYRACIARFPTFQFQASGGIHALSDLSTLNAMGLSAVVTGKALYENRFTVAQALELISTKCEGVCEEEAC